MLSILLSIHGLADKGLVTATYSFDICELLQTFLAISSRRGRIHMFGHTCIVGFGPWAKV